MDESRKEGGYNNVGFRVNKEEGQSKRSNSSESENGEALEWSESSQEEIISIVDNSSITKRINDSQEYSGLSDRLQIIYIIAFPRLVLKIKNQNEWKKKARGPNKGLQRPYK